MDVVGAHHAAGHVVVSAVEHEGADDHQIVDDRRRRRDGIFFDAVFTQAGAQIDCAGVAKVTTRLASGSIERQQAAVHGAAEDAVGTLAFGIGTALPAGDATAVDHDFLRNIDAGVVAPFLHPGTGIKREHIIESGAAVQGVAHHQRRHLPAAARQESVMALDLSRPRQTQLTGAPFPGLAQRVDIGRGDLGGRRIMAAARRGAKAAPFGGRCRAENGLAALLAAGAGEQGGEDE